MSAPSGRFLQVSAPDSGRFGFKVVRGYVPDSAPEDAVLDDIRSLGADIAIFRCPAGCLRQPRALKDAGLVPIHADTLVYYRRELRPRDSVAPGEPPASVRHATPVDRTAISEIVRCGFGRYRNHYHANPLLDDGAILDGYVEWALDYVDSGASPDRQTWVACVESEVAGFATCRLDPDDGTVEIVLNAVSPSHEGKGLYTRLLNSLVDHYGDAGFASLLISTQVWNYRVQRVWGRCGLLVSHALDTYHVNAPRAQRKDS